MSKILSIVSGVIFAAAVAACGGGGGSAPVSTITGNVVKGPVNGATVTFKKADGTVLGSQQTGSIGAYSFETTYQGDITIEATGGSYTDEATGLSKNLTDTLVTVVKTSGNQVVGMVTPFTTMAVKYSTQNNKLPTASVLAQAAKTLASQMGSPSVNLLTTAPQFGASVNAYGQMLQAFSGYLNSAGALNMNQLFQSQSSLTPAQVTAFNSLYGTAYQAANGSTITVRFDPNGFTIGGTGIGGGAGSCRVTTSGVVQSIPFAVSVCASGLPASCESLSASDLQEIGAAYAQAGMTNVQYSTSPTCQAGDIQVNYAP